MENEKPSYYAIIPANVRYDKTLKANEKLMYGEIVCLSNKNGYCHASNSYFAELYEVTPQAISGWIKNLERNGYITCEYLYNGYEIKERRIKIITDTNSTNLEKGINKSLKGYKENFKDNNTSINIMKNNNTSECVPDYIKKDLQKPVAKSNVIYEIFEIIKKHNQEAKKEIPISNDIFQFQCKEGRMLSEILNGNAPQVIINALKNYLLVANMDSWKTYFSFNAFCRNYVEYTDEFFDISKYDKETDTEKICDNFIKQMEKVKGFDTGAFWQNRMDWLEKGRPQGEKYFQWQEEKYKEMGL